MAAKVWRVLVIEDNEVLAQQAAREIRDSFERDESAVVVEIETDFDRGYERVRAGECEIVVLDVRRDVESGTTEDDRTAGRGVFRDIKGARFAPVIFWTALPELVAAEAMSPLVTVVPKDRTEELPGAIRMAIDSKATELIAEIEGQVAETLRRHMWTELGPHWSEYVGSEDPGSIAQVLLSRLVKVLEADREQSLTSRPSHRYVYPPANAVRAPGDVLRDSGDWWIVLTPACDFEQKKVDRVLLARAGLLSENRRFQSWIGALARGGDAGAWNELRARILTATQGRFSYLPAFRDIPDLVVDLEDVRSVKAEEVSDLEAVASLASPFAEALLVQHSHFRGRIGVPDLDADGMKERLRAGLSGES